MADLPPEREVRDSLGTTDQIDLSIASSPTIVTYPTVADKRIEEFIIIAGANGPGIVWVSTDDGTTWAPVLQWGHLAWSLKNNESGLAIKQLKFKITDEDTSPLKVYGFINFSIQDD